MIKGIFSNIFNTFLTNQTTTIVMKRILLILLLPLTGVDLSDYEAVKAYYHLPD